MIICNGKSPRRLAISLTCLMGMLLLPLMPCHSARASSPLREDAVRKLKLNVALFKAISTGDIRSVRAALAGGASANTRNQSGDTPLLEAIGNNSFLKPPTVGKPAIVEVLLKAGANVNLPNRDGQAPLAFAVMLESVPLVQILLDHRADVNAGRAEGKSALGIAMSIGNTALVQLLLARGADARAKDAEGNTMLMDAQSPAVAQLVIARGALVNARNRSGDTALKLAMETDSLDLAKTLLEAGADPNAADAQGVAPLSWAIVAALRGDTTVVRALLDRGADVNHDDKLGQTPLNVAAQNGEAEVVTLLLEHGADPIHRNLAGGTALTEVAADGMHAVISRAVHPHDSPPPPPEVVADLIKKAGDIDTAIVQSLLAKGVDAHGPEGRTALLLASASGNEAVAKALLAAGTDPNTTTTGSLTPLATYRFSEPSFNPSHLGIGDAVPSQMTPLMYAVYNRHADVAQALLAGKVALNLQDTSGATALMYAAEMGDEPVVSLLLKQGADVNLRDKMGWTALMRLAARGAREAVTDMMPAGKGEMEPERPGMSRKERDAVKQANSYIRANNAEMDAITAQTLKTAEAADLVIAKALLAHGAITSVQDGNKQTALALAEKAHNQALILLLRSHAVQ